MSPGLLGGVGICRIQSAKCGQAIEWVQPRLLFSQWEMELDPHSQKEGWKNSNGLTLQSPLIWFLVSDHRVVFLSPKKRFLQWGKHKILLLGNPPHTDIPLQGGMFLGLRGLRVLKHLLIKHLPSNGCFVTGGNFISFILGRNKTRLVNWFACVIQHLRGWVPELISAT